MKTCINLLALVAILIVGACSPAAAPAAAPTAAPMTAPLTLIDGLGRTVTFAAAPKRILSIAPGVTETLYAIGAGGVVVGRDQFSDYPVEVKNLPSIGTLRKISSETIVSLKPDLVLAGNITSAEQVKGLEDLKLTVFVVPNPTNLDDLYQSLELVGKITGHEKDARDLAEKLKQRAAVVIEKTKQTQSRPTVFYEIDGTDPLKPWTAGPGSFIGNLITLAGGQNVGQGLKSSWAQISSEEVVRLQPEIILLGDGVYGITPESVAKRAGWDQLPAIKKNAIYIFDDNLVSRPGPRLVEGLETLAKLIHPELFK